MGAVAAKIFPHESLVQGTSGSPKLGVDGCRVTTLRAGIVQKRFDCLVQEVPIALVFNGITHAVMMGTPMDLKDFALGFSLSEGLISIQSELYSVEIYSVSEGINGDLAVEIQMHISSEREWKLKERRRTMAGRTGCGLCGVDSLEQACHSLSPVPEVSVPSESVARAHRLLKNYQPLQQQTGAVHAAAWCDLHGQVLFAREDVGRHNALDKLIGAIATAKIDTQTGFVCISSRASYEMVQKTAAANVGVLAAVSAPTARAVHTAQRCNMALAGFVRGADMVAYTYPERFHMF